MTIRYVAWAHLALVVGSTGCIQGLTQVAGTGAVYHTRCTADMVPSDGQYVVQCAPEACAPGFSSGPVSHVAVTMDPGRKIVGYAERVCIQDLSRAPARFTTASAGSTVVEGATPAQ